MSDRVVGAQFARASKVVMAETPVFARVFPSALLSTAAAAAATEAPSAVAEAPQVVTMPLAVKAPLLDLDAVRWLDPQLSAAIAAVRPHSSGVMRSQLTVPISPSADVIDTVLFESAVDPAQKFFLPRYRLATERTTAGAERYRVALQDLPPGWALRVRFEKHPAPEIEEAARTATELPHHAAVILRFMLSGGTGIEKELAFADVVPVEGGLEASLQIPTLPERDEIYDALTRREANATLTVRRAVDIAIPVGIADDSGVKLPPELTLVRPRIPRPHQFDFPLDISFESRPVQ